jgi:hypothetical protein
MKLHLLLQVPHEARDPFLWLAFPQLRKWQVHNHFTNPTKGKARVSSQSSTKRSSWHQPPRQLGGHPPRVTSSRCITRTNRNRELNTMQGCKERTSRKVLKSFSLTTHQSNKCYDGIGEEEQWWRSTNDSKILIQWVNLT